MHRDQILDTLPHINSMRPKRSHNIAELPLRPPSPTTIVRLSPGVTASNPCTKAPEPPCHAPLLMCSPPPPAPQSLTSNVRQPEQ